MNRTTSLLAAIAATLAFAGPALAERGSDHAAFAERMFERVDTNTDGAIDNGEFTAAGKLRFERRDANGDGYLDKAEFTAPRERPEGAPELTEERQRKHAEMTTRFFERLDTDADAQISETEAEAAGTRMFARLDTDGDGRIALEEMRKPHHGKPETR